MSPPPLGMRCALHAGAVAIDICTRCGSAVCGACVRTLGGELGCAPCASRSVASGVPLPSRVTLALGTAVAGLVLPLAALVALGLTWDAGARVRRDRYSLRAERWFRAARSLAVIGSVFWGLFTALGLGLFLFFLSR